MTDKAQDLIRQTNIEVFCTYIPQLDFHIHHQG